MEDLPINPYCEITKVKCPRKRRVPGAAIIYGIHGSQCTRAQYAFEQFFGQKIYYEMLFTSPDTRYQNAIFYFAKQTPEIKKFLQEYRDYTEYLNQKSEMDDAMKRYKESLKDK